MEQVLEILSYVGWVLLAITILVFVHEMGHFLTAKMFKMRVDKFSVGFPPKILGTRIGETEYVIGATPLGGYVKIAGMVDESMDTDFVQSEPQPWEFRSKPVWQRIIVITAGVFFNVLLAAAIFIGLKYAYGETYIPAENIEGLYVSDGSVAHNMGLRTGDRVLAVGGEPIERYGDIEGMALLADPLTMTISRDRETLTLTGPEDIMTQLSRAGDDGFGIGIDPSLISSIERGYPAETIGLQEGDMITSIDGSPVQFWNQMTDLLQRSGGQPIEIQWQRPLELADEPASLDNEVTILERTPDHVTYRAEIAPQYSESLEKYMLGVGPPTRAMLTEAWGVREQKVSLFEAVNLGMRETWQSSIAIVTSLKRIFTGRENLRDNLGGPVAVAKVTKKAADAGAPFFWRIVAMLSITLAIMNILPIPALDGGHLIFLIYEGITRREPSLKVRMWLQQAGMVLLLVFMTFLVFNDILRL